MARAPDPIDRFGRFLAQSEHDSLTIKNYQSDLDTLAVWFQSANGERMALAKVTPTDLKPYQRWLIEQRGIKPSSVHGKLATLRRGSSCRQCR
jgi:site-specific recombinase XerD